MSRRLELLVEDAQGRLVLDLGRRTLWVPPGPLRLSSSLFQPEQGTLKASAGAAAWAWNGDNSAGEPVPDGAYRLVLQEAGKPDQDAGFWVEHGAIAEGAFLLAPQPARSQVTAFLSPPPGTQVELRVYDLGGGLVMEWSLPSGATKLLWDLRNSSGRPVSSGLYLVEARYLGQGSRRSAMRKLAVLR